VAISLQHWAEYHSYVTNDYGPQFTAEELCKFRAAFHSILQLTVNQLTVNSTADRQLKENQISVADPGLS